MPDALTSLQETVLAALAAASTSVVVVDVRAAGEPIIYCNAAFEALTGYPRATIVGHNCRFLQGPDTDPGAVAAVRAAIAAGRDTRVELLNYTREGRPFWNELHLSPVRDGAGRLTHYFGFQKDVTELKLAREEIAGLQAAERARSRELERLKDAYLDTVSHEVRTPVHAMIGLIQLMQAGDGGPLTDVQRADLATLRGQAAILADLVGDLLDLGQLRAGRMSLQPVPTELGALATRAVEQLASVAAAAQVRLVVEAPTPVPVLVDPRRCEQVVRNLVHNAIKASPKGAHVTLVVAASEGGASLSVTDRGPGIAPADQAQIFERFVRLHTAGDRPMGSGLGLAISKEFVEAQGGRIGVSSRPGAGSTFWLWLPPPTA